MTGKIASKTEAIFMTVLKAVYPEAMTRTGIRRVTGIHPKSLELLLARHTSQLEEIKIKGNVSAFRLKQKAYK